MEKGGGGEFSDGSRHHEVVQQLVLQKRRVSYSIYNCKVVCLLPVMNTKGNNCPWGVLPPILFIGTGFSIARISERPNATTEPSSNNDFK